MIIKDKNELIKPCEDVSKQEGLLISALLLSELEKHPNGVGLAAPQIGLHKKVFYLRYKDFTCPFINPVITETKEPFIHKNEGCLSFPGVYIDTIRYNKIKIKDEFGQQELEGFHAVIAQHEYEHISEKIFFDSKVPQKYDECFCGSQKKFKFCCLSKLKDA